MTLNFAARLTTTYRHLAILVMIIFLLTPTLTSAMSPQLKNVIDLGIGYFDPEASQQFRSSCVGELSGADNAEKVWNFLIGMGYSPEQTAGVLGNMAVESGFEPMRLQNTPAGTETPSNQAESSSLGWGLVQWTPARKIITTSRSQGVPYSEINTVEYQLTFLLGQLTGEISEHSEKAAGDHLLRQTTVAGATESFMKRYERPRDQSSRAVQKRVEKANNYFTKFSGNTTGGATTCNNSSWTWPTSPTTVITSCFGPRGVVNTGGGRTGSRNHRGIDLSSGTGTPIYAAADGRVVFSGEAGNAGLMVTIEHNENLITRYFHASKLLVNNGDSVTAGQHIADEGSTGNSSGPHLHFEIIRNNKHIDPFTELVVPATVNNQSNCSINRGA